MKLYDLKTFCIVTDIEEHKNNKEKLISLINKMNLNSSIEKNEHITKTDWNLPKEVERQYLNFFYNMITPYMKKMANMLKCKTWKIDNVWYQMYKQNDYHSWHIHMYSNYTNVYYLDLPEESLKTQLYDLKDEKIIDDIEIREGQLFTFPAHIIHRSPVNTTNKEKKIISFNSNFDDIDKDNV